MKQTIFTLLTSLVSCVSFSANIYWANEGTDFNDGMSWVGGVAPGANDIAVFSEPMVTQPVLTQDTMVRGIYFCDPSKSGFKDLTTSDGYNGYNYSGYVLSASGDARLTLTGSGTGDGSYCFMSISAGTNRIDVPVAFSASNNQKRMIRVDGGLLAFDKPIATLGENNTVETNFRSSGQVEFNADNSDWHGTYYISSASRIYVNHPNALAGLSKLEFQNWAAGAASGFTTDKRIHLINQTGETLSFDAIVWDSHNNDGMVFEGAPFDLSKTTLRTDLRNSTDYLNAYAEVTLGDVRSTGAYANSVFAMLGYTPVKMAGTFSVENGAVGNVMAIRDGCFLPLTKEVLGSSWLLSEPGKFGEDLRPVLGLVFDYEPKVGQVPGGFIVGNNRSRGGFAAFEADRRICYEGDASVVITNGLALPSNSNYHLFPEGFIFGNADADATAILVNPIDLNNGDRTYFAVKGKAFMDGRIAGDITSVANAGRKLHKRGNGNLALDGENTYTGSSTVYEGGLFINGSVACDYTVESDALLGGTGTLQNVYVKTGAALNPGELGGEMTVHGELQLNANSRLRIQVQEATNGSINIASTSKRIRAVNPVQIELELSDGAPRAQKIKVLDASNAVSPTEITALNPDLYEVVVDPEVLSDATLSVEDSVLYLTYTRAISTVDAPIVVKANSAEKEYDGVALVEDGYTVEEEENLVSGDVVVAVVMGTLTDVGTTENVVSDVRILRGDADVTAFYTHITTENGTLDVTPRSVVIVAGSATKVYDGTPLTEGGYSVSGFVEGEGISSVTMTEDAILTEPGTTPNRVASHAFAAGTKAGNYTVTYEDGTLKVTPRSGIHVIAASDEKVYDGTALTNGNYTVETAVLLPGDEVVAVVVGSVTNVGEVVNEVVDVRVVHGDEDVTHHYTGITTEDGELGVTPRPAVIVAASAEKVYDGTPLTEGGHTVEGFVEGEGVESVIMTPESTLTTPGAIDNEIAYYVLSEGTDPNNYEISCVVGTLTVMPIAAEIVVTANSAEKVYDGMPLVENGYTVQGTENLVLGDEVVAVVTGTLTDAGTAANVVTDVRMMRGDTDVTAYYTHIVKENGELDVRPRFVVITADSAEKDYDGEPLTEDGVTAEGFVPGEGVAVAIMTEASTLTDPGTVANVIKSVILTHGTNPSNYTFSYEEGTLTVYSPRDPLIAEFSLAIDDRALHTMRVYTLGMREGDTLYFGVAETYEEACAGEWTYLADSDVPYGELDIGQDNLSGCRDIALDDAGYRFFRPYIRTPNGTVYPGRKFVGVVDVPMDCYGETSVGVPFVECLSEAGELPGIGVVEPDISLRNLVQTDTLIAGSARAADQLYLLQEDATFDVYRLGSNSEWVNADGMGLPAIGLPRGAGFSIVRKGRGNIQGTIRLHGQVSETPAPIEIPQGRSLVQVSNSIPGPLDLNDMVHGIPGIEGDKIIFMTENDFQLNLYYGDPTKSGTPYWYYEQTVFSRGKPRTTYLPAPHIPSGRIFWFSSEKRIFSGAYEE